jgi:hypothetical protein
MKKIVFGMLMLMSFLSNAQDTIQKQKMHFGLRAGLSIPSVTFEATTAPRFSENIYFGALIEYKFDDIGIELAGNYLQTTSEFVNVPNVTGSNYYELKSVLTSLALKYYPVDKFAIKVGAYYGFDFGSRFYLEKNVSNAPDYIDIEQKDSGVLFGMECKVYKGLFVDTNLTFDLNNDDGIKNSYILFGLGYKM